VPSERGNATEPIHTETLRYQTNSPTYTAFTTWLTGVINDEVQEHRKDLVAPQVSHDQLKQIIQPVAAVTKGLTNRNPVTGEIEDGKDEDMVAAFLVPFGVMMLMLMMVFIGATPLMQGVVEEKMQRIAEVLLGSVQPFQLMMGKLMGLTAVSLTLAAIYLGATYGAAAYFKFTALITPELVIWFMLYLILAMMMYGSLFIAVGAACTDLRETQNLLWPIMLLALFPTFLFAPIRTEPNSPFAVWASLFPFGTPMLMVARMAVQQEIPVWQPAVGAVLVLVTTLGCVYAAGRIFRVGILLQGKGARFGEMMHWVARG
jgi:ABC-2 type transport system permease protein